MYHTNSGLTTPPSPNGHPQDHADSLRLFLADSDADVEAIVGAIPGANYVQYKFVADLDGIRNAAELAGLALKQA